MPLLAAYNFDEPSGNVLDRSGNGRDWALNTGAQRTTGDGGHTDEGLTKLGAGLATVAAPAFGQTSGRTFMFWLKGQGNAVWWLRYYITAADTGAWGLYLLGGNLTLRLRKGGTNTNTTVPWTDDGLWHHYACTYDGTNGRLYKDGVLVATSGAVTAPLDTADSIQILETSLTTQTMDDLRVYDEALSQSTIATLMNMPVGAAIEERSGTVTLAATATLSRSGTKAVGRSLPLAASAGIALAGGKSASGAAALTAISDIEVVGTHTAARPMPIALTAGIAAVGSTARFGSVTLSAVARMQAGQAAEARNITLTASLAAQPVPSTTAGPRRWTATLGEQP